MKFAQDSVRRIACAMQVATGLALLALLPLASGAQTGGDSSMVTASSAATATAAASVQLSLQPITLCIVPGSGTAYRVGEQGLPTQCLSVTHTLVTLNVTGPQGLQGLTGAKGDSGPTGPAGAKGDSGAAGLAGAQGDSGAVGPAGPKGDAGAVGPAGAKGDSGAVGPPGDVGMAGEAGLPGKAGAIGATGPAGAAGPQGQPGLQGEPGEPGSTDHNTLTNLTVDSHPQYLLAGPRTAINGFVVSGETNEGSQAPSGAGTRLLWNPNRAAFRAGNVSDTQWDHTQIGLYSAAFGNNTIASGQGSVAAGENTRATGAHSFAMGPGARASASGAVAFGGEAAGSNSISVGEGSVAAGTGSVAMGFNSRAMGDHSMVIGTGTASGVRSVILGGGNIAMETGSVSIGLRAFSSRAGAVVISAEHADLGGFVQPTAQNQFVVRAGGGTIIYSNSATTLGVTLAANGGSWSSVSDRNKKAEFRDVDGEWLLTQLRTVPVTSWKYKAQDQLVRHIGPMAQDWQQAFGLNSDSTTINSGDIAGVTLAGVQALDARTIGSAQRIIALENEVRELQRTVHELLRALNASDAMRTR